MPHPDGIPFSLYSPQVSVADTLLRILSVVYDAVRERIEDCSIFGIQLPYPLFRPLKKHLYDGFIVYHLTASFPASLIYYGFIEKNYIRAELFKDRPVQRKRSAGQTAENPAGPENFRVALRSHSGKSNLHLTGGPFSAMIWKQVSWTAARTGRKARL